MVEKEGASRLVNFRYDIGDTFDLDAERKKMIKQGFDEAEERRKKSRRNRMIFWILFVLVILMILGYVLLRR